MMVDISTKEFNKSDCTSDDLNENDFIVDETMQGPSISHLSRPRFSVSAEAYGEWNKKNEFKPTFHHKGPEECQQIREILENSFMFSSLGDEDLDIIIGSFLKETFRAGDFVIRQGGDGDKLYIIAEGTVDVIKKKDHNLNGGDIGGESDKNFYIIGQLSTGDVFGELALLYNAPRAASIRAQTDLSLWSIDRLTFNNVVRDAVMSKRNLYEKYLKEIKLFENMDSYEISKVADSLKETKSTKDEIIITEGETGNFFYIIIDGEVEVLKEGEVVLNIRKGGFFGELALMNNMPRAATVKAKTDCRLVTLDRKGFNRILGSIEDILRRNMKNYN